MRLKHNVSRMDRYEGSLEAALSLVRNPGPQDKAFDNECELADPAVSALLAARIGEACRVLAHSEQLRKSAEVMLAEAQCRAERIHEVSPRFPVHRGFGIARRSNLTVRVAVYSDEPMLTAGLQKLVATDPKLKLSGSCHRIDQLKVLLAAGKADVAVVDFTEEITADTLIELRNLAGDCKLILWTNAIEGDMAFRAMRFGVRGVLRKSLPLEAHRQCLHNVSAGDLWFERETPESVN